MCSFCKHLSLETNTNKIFTALVLESKRMRNEKKDSYSLVNLPASNNNDGLPGMRRVF